MKFIKQHWIAIAAGMIALDYLIAKSSKPGLSYYRGDPSSGTPSQGGTSFTRAQIAGPLSHALGLWYPA